MKLIITSNLVVVNPDDELIEKATKELTVSNPAYYLKQNCGYGVNTEPKQLELFTHTGEVLELPRGYDIREAFPRFDEVDNQVTYGAPIELTDVTIKPYSYQQEATEAFVASQQGGVIAPCGAGKTEIAINIINTLRTTTLILVHTNDLRDQWLKRIKSRLGYEAGTVGGGKKVNVKDITVATVASLYSIKGIRTYTRDSLYDKFGLVILDEAHHAPAKSWMVILAKCRAAMRLWLTATENRRDGLGPLIPLCCGRIVYRVDHDKLLAAGRIMAPLHKAHMLNIIKGEFTRKILKSGVRQTVLDRHKLMAAVARHQDRMAYVCGQVIKDYKEGRVILILAQGNVEMCESIFELLLKHIPEAKPTILTGSGKYPTEQSQRAALLDNIRNGGSRVLIATKIAEEGLDLPILDSLHLIYPSPECEQAVGRICRTYPNKKDPIVHDYVDSDIDYLVKCFQKRCKIITKIGGRRI